MSARKFLAALVITTSALAVSAVAPSSAFAATAPSAPSVAQNVEKLSELKGAGATDAEIKAQTGLERVKTTLDPLSASASSTSGDVTVNAPSIYYDTLAKYYIASAGFKWNNDNWKNDLPHLAAGDQAMGGSDGFGIQTDRSIQNLNGSMRIYPSTAGNHYYKEYTTSNYFDNSGLGETININDRANAGLIEYSAARGDHTWAFKRNGTGCANFSARYVHTWKDSKLTGFSVSATGFGVSVSNSNESFQRTSPVVRFGC